MKRQPRYGGSAVISCSAPDDGRSPGTMICKQACILTSGSPPSHKKEYRKGYSSRSSILFSSVRHRGHSDIFVKDHAEIVRITISDQFRNLRRGHGGTAKQQLRLFDADLCQVFDETGSHLLFKYAAEMACTQPHISGHIGGGEICFLAFPTTS